MLDEACAVLQHGFARIRKASVSWLVVFIFREVPTIRSGHKETRTFQQNHPDL